MKKIIITTLAFAIPFVKSYSQVQFGIKAGLNVAEIQNFKFSDQDKPRLALNCGLLTQFKLNNKLFIQPELLYSSKGFKFSESTLNSDGELSLNYISAPVLVGFSLSNKFALLLGPEASFLISANTSIDEKSQNITSTYNRFDIALDLGVAFKINKTIVFDFRYSYGFPILSGGVIPHPVIDYHGIRNGSNVLLQIGLTYLFKSH